MKTMFKLMFREIQKNVQVKPAKKQNQKQIF
jgi:hypothetical protein